MIGLADIVRARERIAGSVAYTACTRSVTFSQRCDTTAYFKLEHRQFTGSFKERGALNKILTLDADERRRGIITASAGNHAQAVAYHARAQSLAATVVMPRRTPLVKVSNTRELGAEVILAGDTFDDAVARARELERERDLVFVHPFDDEAVIAGQGTIGLEILEQVPDVELVIVPIGGGGVISGIAIACKETRPEIRVVGVETSVYPSMRESLEAGKPISLPPASTIADGIAIKRPGELTLAYVERYVDDIVTVDDEEIANAILLLLEKERMVVEGAGATPLAALYNGHVPAVRDRSTCMVLCGGNIDVNLLARIIERGLTKDGRMIRVTVTIADRPGALAGLLDLVGEAGANVLEVHHDRTFSGAALGDVEVELTLETRGPDHVDEVHRALTGRGFGVERARR